MYKETRHYEGGEERSGKLAEMFILGRVKIDNPDYLNGVKKCAGKEGRDFAECAFDLVKKFQPFGPEKPMKPLLRDLLEYFNNKAGFKSEADKKRAKIYTAVDSIVDTQVGADAFFEIIDEEGAPIFVTVDYTKRNEKDYTHADVLLDNVPEAEDDPNGYRLAIENATEKAAKVYQLRVSGQIPQF